jgi:site-specific recombinase XerD
VRATLNVVRRWAGCTRPGLDAGADLAFVKDWLGHANIQNTTIYARLTTATLDSTARKVFASHRVV